MAQSHPVNPSFVCSSGKLLWGQLHCIAEGFLSENIDSESTMQNAVPTGTIIQRNFNYKVNAALGLWNVKDIIYQPQPKEPSSLAGFIVYNKEVADPVAILKACAELGMSSNKDKTIIYVNRYDWSWAHEPSDASEQLLYDGLNDDAKQMLKKVMGNRIILADASTGLAVIKHVKENLAGIPKNELIKGTLSVEHNSVGVHLACQNSEYELGWMVFSPSNKEELIAFVYDGAYTALEGNISLAD